MQIIFFVIAIFNLQTSAQQLTGTPPVQFVNGGILQINNNERTTEPSHIPSPTPVFQPQAVQPQQQQVLPIFPLQEQQKLPSPSGL